VALVAVNVADPDAGAGATVESNAQSAGTRVPVTDLVTDTAPGRQSLTCSCPGRDGRGSGGSCPLQAPTEDRRLAIATAKRLIVGGARRGDDTLDGHAMASLTATLDH
jgi:hypothetical protein